MELLTLPITNYPYTEASLSLGVTLLIIFVALGIGKILTGITIWRFLKKKDKHK